MGREKVKRKCRKCGKNFEHAHYREVCPQCISEQATKCKQVENELKRQQKIRWQNYLRTVKIIEPAILVYGINEDTEEYCAICGIEHYKKKEYNHPFSLERIEQALPLSQVNALLIEYEEQKSKNKTVIQFLNERGLLFNNKKEEKT